MLRQIRSAYFLAHKSAGAECFQPFTRSAPRVASCLSVHTSARDLATVCAVPQVCLHDVHTTITLADLPPSSPVTVRAQVFNENGKKFCSHAQYVSSSDGEVCLDRDASVGGSYTGVFPAGLLTTLAPAPGEFAYLRLFRRNPAIPWNIKVSAHLGHHDVSNEEPADAIASLELTRLIMAPGVTRRRVRHGRVRGVLYMPPPHHGPAVGVVDMFGAVGGIMEFRAAMLASRGYAVLSLPFFGYEDLPAMPVTLELEYFEEACNYVMAQENVIPDRCGMISVSKSTDIALLLSTKMPALTAVVCIGVVSVSYDTNLTYKGELVAEGIKIGAEMMTFDEEGRVRPSRERILDVNKESLTAAALHLEEASPECHYLVVAGSEDTWLCFACVEHLQEYMTQHNRADKMQGIIYEGAGHLIEPPYGPLIHHSYQRILPIQRESVTDGDHSASETNNVTHQNDLPGGVGEKDGYITGVPILFGGEAKPTCDAQVDLWSRMQTFLDLRVKHCSPWYQNYLTNAPKSDDSNY